MTSQQQVLACYNQTARQYAAAFAQELAHKHFDRLLLRAFAQENAGRGRLLDLGCGPGQTTAFLAACGVADGLGVDISPEMVRVAQELHPTLAFTTGDLLQLDFPAASVGAAVALYAIVHFDDAQLRTALQEVYRVLQPGGELLFSFHVGEAIIHRDEFLGEAVNIDFRELAPGAVLMLAAEAGFTLVDSLQRQPYPEEYPTQRAYLWVRKPVAVAT